MGGGNGLKSHMSQQKNAAKAAAEKAGGGGAAGKAERTESKIGIKCAICLSPFQSMKMKAQLREHWQAKHAAKTFPECFPGQTLEG